MLTEVKEQLDVCVELTDVARYSSLGAFCALLESDNLDASAHDLMIRLHLDSPASAPLLAVAGIGGHALRFVPLASTLPVFTILIAQAPAVTDDTPP